jgi:hypothetical protein
MGFKLFLFILTIFNGLSVGHGAIKSAVGENLLFDSQSNDQIDAVIGDGKLGIGVIDPSANLHVAGLSILDEMNVSSVVMPFQTISDHASVLSDESLVFVDSSLKSLSVQLPDPSVNLGKIYHLKKRTSKNQVLIHSNGNLIDDKYQSSLLDLGHVQLVSNGSEWMTLTQYNLNSSFSSNLIAWFPFDEPNTDRSLDITENELIANRINYASSSEGWTEGVSGNAIQLDGVDDSLEVDSNQLFDSVVDLSITFWLKFNTLSSGYVLALSNNPSGGSARGVRITYNTGGNQIKSTTKLAYDPFTGVNQPRVSSGVVQLDTWIFVSYSYDADGKIRIGMDDSFSTNDALGSYLINGYELKVGNFHGAIDDLRIYDKALSQNEILELYESYQTP